MTFDLSDLGNFFLSNWCLTGGKSQKKKKPEGIQCTSWQSLCDVQEVRTPKIFFEVVILNNGGGTSESENMKSGRHTANNDSVSSQSNYSVFDAMLNVIHQAMETKLLALKLEKRVEVLEELHGS